MAANIRRKPVEHRVFVSHAAADATLAERFAQTLREKLKGVEVFVSSEPGSIPTGEKWLNFVETKLINASAYLILLTPASFKRPWLWFETGSVWFRKDRRIFAVCAGLDKSAVLYPLGALQVKSLDDAGEIRVLMNELGAPCNESEAERLLTFFKTENPTIQEHVTIGESHFVWAGALDALEDRPATHPPVGLQKTLEGQGFIFRCGLPDKTTHWGEKGFFPLYVSDRAKWKRALVCPTSPEQIVFVKPPVIESKQA